uniref:Uncharacterized protein n=1 Tax=Rhinella marina erythrocytic-like virus TaxID=2859906 RepID=A0A8F6YI17_9VIRU|nr:hypothetical protein RMELV028 [Rhinella marina erythrocytic-like virus]
MDRSSYKYIIIILACAVGGYFLLREMPLISAPLAGGALGTAGIGYYLYRSGELNKLLVK